MNKVVLIGRLTKDPELKYTPGSGTPVCTFKIAVDRRIPNKNGEREADFIPVIVWNKIAESCASYLNKGNLCGVSGRIQTRSYELTDGSKRYATEIVADEVQFLEKKSGSGANESSLYNTEPPAARGSNFNPIGSIHDFEDEMTPIDDGEIPF